ncbi:hypothetical protein [Streptomyces sp. NPDC015350]|uniref:hypothetical protein n=1 Tax=Streptomyces sp. NPDC015350 TaxID=3364955 RepID=UPI0036FA933E
MTTPDLSANWLTAWQREITAMLEQGLARFETVYCYPSGDNGVLVADNRSRAAAARLEEVEIRDNLLARIEEAKREGWLGEVEGLRASLEDAEEKLAQLDRRSRTSTPVDLGIPHLTSPRRREGNCRDHSWRRDITCRWDAWTASRGAQL